MFVKKFLWVLLMVPILGAWVIPSPVYAKENPLQVQLLDHVGKSYSGTQDPSYLDYDLALRKYVADRILKRFGIALDPQIYSGFDLLDIEALFKCKKAIRTFRPLLKNVCKMTLAIDCLSKDWANCWTRLMLIASRGL